MFWEGYAIRRVAGRRARLKEIKVPLRSRADCAAISPDRFPHRDIRAFEQLYNRIPPQNYGWYECRLHVAAKRVYDAGGPAVLRRLWDRFRLSDAELAVALEEVEPELLRVQSDWPRAVGEVAL